MFGKPYARGGAVFPGTFVRVLKIEGKCSCLRAKAAHISGHLPVLGRLQVALHVFTVGCSNGKTPAAHRGFPPQ